MMNIREYFETLYRNTNDYNFDEVVNYEEEVYEMDGEEFTQWAKEHNVDLEARDGYTGELVVTLWSWDMCDE